MAVARSGILWRRIFAVLLIASAISYYRYQQNEFPHGGSRTGIVYGVIGLGLIYLLAFFAIRKSRYKSTLRTTEQSLQSKISHGIIAVALLQMHTGTPFIDK